MRNRFTGVMPALMTSLAFSSLAQGGYRNSEFDKLNIGPGPRSET